MSKQSFTPQQDDTLQQEKKSSVDRYIITRLFRYVKPYYKLVAIAVCITIAGSFLGPLRPYLTKIAIDDYIARGDFKGLTIVSIFLAGAILLDGIKQYSVPLQKDEWKFDALCDIYSQLNINQAIIYCNKRQRVLMQCFRHHWR